MVHQGQPFFILMILDIARRADQMRQIARPQFRCVSACASSTMPSSMLQLSDRPADSLLPGKRGGDSEAGVADSNAMRPERENDVRPQQSAL